MNKSSSCSSVILKPQRFTESADVPLESQDRSSLHQSSSALMFLHCAPITPFTIRKTIPASSGHSVFPSDARWLPEINGLADWRNTWKFHYKNLQPLISIGAFVINSYDALAVREVWSGADGGSRLDVCVCVHCKPVQWLSSVILYSD